MVIQNEAHKCALYVLINSQYPSKMHANKQLAKSENWTHSYCEKKIPVLINPLH